MQIDGKDNILENTNNQTSSRHFMIQWQPLLGGIIIGFSAILLFVSIRRIAGISGLVKQVLFSSHQKDKKEQQSNQLERLWPLLFLVGLMVGTLIYAMLFEVEGSLREGYPKGLLIASGLLVGIGTYIGNGCTSGHGVCGIGRLSKRSIVATVVFMVFGVLSVTALRIFS